MNKNFEWRYVWQFFLLLLVQVLLMDKIALWGMLTPMLYLLYILTLPFRTPRWLVVLLGFVMGFCVDCFSGIMGVHAAATTFVAFLRPLVINLIPAKSTMEEHLRPILWDMHFGWFALYSLSMAFIHQFLLCFFDAFSLSGFFHLLWVSLLNALFTTVVIFIAQCLFYSASKRY